MANKVARQRLYTSYVPHRTWGYHGFYSNKWLEVFLIPLGWYCKLVLGMLMYVVGGEVASWLVRLTPDQVVRVWDLAGDIALCLWAKHLTLTVPLSTQMYKWVPVNSMLGVTLWWTSIPSRGGSRSIPSHSINRDKLWPNGPLGSYADFMLI